MTLAFLCGVLAGLAGQALVLLVVLVLVRPYARRAVAAERARFSALDAKTWRPVAPMLIGAQPGSLSAIAGLVQAEAPAGLTYTFRARDTNALPTGVVRISLEAGNRNEE